MEERCKQLYSHPHKDTFSQVMHGAQGTVSGGADRGAEMLSGTETSPHCNSQTETEVSPLTHI